MASTYGRLTGKAGVCMSTLGPGATNLVTSAAIALIIRDYDNRLARINDRLEDTVRKRTRALRKTRVSPASDDHSTSARFS